MSSRKKNNKFELIRLLRVRALLKGRDVFEVANGQL